MARSRTGGGKKVKRDWNKLKSPLGKSESVISQRAAQTRRQPLPFEYNGVYGKKGHMFLNSVF